MPADGWNIESRAIRAGRKGSTPSLAPILWSTSTFATPEVDEARRMATSVGADRFYSCLLYTSPSPRD